MTPKTVPTLRIAIGLSLGAALSLGLARFAYGLLLPPMRADLGWSYALAGAMNTSNAAGYLLGALVTPALLRRFDEHVEFPPPTLAAKTALAAKVCAKHGVTPPDVTNCANFDEVTKRCLTHARREAMKEILGITDDEQENDDGDQKEDRVH